MSEDLDESTQDSGRGLNGDSKKDKKKTCMQCGTLRKKLKLKVFYKGEQVKFCNEDCFKAFKDKQPRKKEKCEACHEEIESGGFLCSRLGTQQPLCSAKCFELMERKHTPKRACLVCMKQLNANDPEALLWEAMEFCGVPCLRKYQLQIGSQCANCNVVVQETSLGKYCVRFGADIRQFCSGKCLEEFKKGLKVCAYCQMDLTREKIQPIVAQVGERGIFKDFCSRECVKSYESLSPNKTVDPTEKCKICPNKCGSGKQLQFKYGAENDQWGCVCSEQCLARFRFDQKLDSSYCENCQCFTTKQGECITLQLGLQGSRKKFCTKTCLNLFVLSHRKIVPCSWCKVKKYNFDMIEKNGDNELVQLFCSINCLNLHKSKSSNVHRQQTAQNNQRQVVVQQNLQNRTTSSIPQNQQSQQQNQPARAQQGVKCDQCAKIARPQFHLTMSDTSVRNFCCYTCAVAFQNMFKNKQPANQQQQQQQQQTQQTAIQQQAMQVLQQQQQQTLLRNKVVLTAQTVTIPQQQAQQNVQKRLQTTSQVPIVTTTKQATANRTVFANQATTQVTIGAQAQLPPGVSLLHNVPVVVRPPPPKEVKNKSTQCKPPEEEDEKDKEAMEEAVTGKKKPSIRKLIKNVDLLEADFEKDALEEFVKELQEFTNKLTERLKETKINGGLNHDESGTNKRKRDDDENPQLNGDHDVKRTKKESNDQVLIDEALEKWHTWLNEAKEDLKISSEDITKLSPEELNKTLCSLGKRGQGDATVTEILRLVKIFLGIQIYLQKSKSEVNIFNGVSFCGFNDYLCTLTSSIDDTNALDNKGDLIDEELFWRTGQLGPENPEVLLNTVAFILAKTANITDPEIHSELTVNKVSVESQEIDGKSVKVLKVNNEVVKQQNTELDSRCPVAIVEAYISKRPSSKSQQGCSFYLEPKRGPVDQSSSDPWYTEDSVEIDRLARALNRFKVLRMH